MNYIIVIIADVFFKYLLRIEFTNVIKIPLINIAFSIKLKIRKNVKELIKL